MVHQVEQSKGTRLRQGVIEMCEASAVVDEGEVEPDVGISRSSEDGLTGERASTCLY